MDLYQQPSQALLSKILDAAADAIIAIDENRKILLFSQSAERLFGYRADEVLGQPLDLLLPPDVAAAHLQHIRQFVLSDTSSRPMTDRVSALGWRRDGSKFPVEINISKLTHRGRTVLVAVAREITARQDAEQALIESEERYRSIVAAMSEGVVMQDAVGRIIACNDSAERILGLTAIK